MPTKTRSAERTQLLADLLAGAIEHCGYGFPLIHEWHCPDGDEASWFAMITDRFVEEDRDVEEPPQVPVRVDLDTMARGLGLIRRAFLATDGVPRSYLLKAGGDPSPSEDVILVNPDTWERMYLPTELRRDLLEYDRSNGEEGEEGDWDVVGALAVLEIAMFGKVEYA